MRPKCSFLHEAICRHPVIGPAIVQQHECDACIAYNGAESEELTRLAEYRERIQKQGEPQFNGVKPIRMPCLHRGAQRKCCGQMYICRQAPNTNCIMHGIGHPDLRVCQSCELWEPIQDPFIGVPQVHFGFHLWPITNRFEWHIAQIAKVASQINGLCIVGVATSSESESAETVRKMLPANCEIYEFENTSEGENETFRHLQERVPKGNDDVLVYAHGKGVTDTKYESHAVRMWTDIMYETVVFNRYAIVQQMHIGYKVAGSFRTFAWHPGSPRYGWYFSGTFFAVRAKYLDDKPVIPQYGGVEAWPGNHFQPDESYCMFADEFPHLAGYDLEHMESMHEELMRFRELATMAGMNP